ncbi:MAG TPA: T9SS type A sorting domain-containing protein [Ignavibacteria bacterium]|nr:T9SS type A sorting domain-containing protein [Ignavibacteria bacterium]
MSKFTKVIFALMFAVMLFPYEYAMSQFQTGDVFVAVGNGQVQWRQPNGTLVQTLNTGQGGFTTGMAIDSASKLYVTNFSVSTVSVFDKFGVLQGNFGSGYQTPESIVFDNQYNVYVGNLSNGIRKFDYNGNFIATVGPNTDFHDLNSDQCTGYITHEGSIIDRHNYCTNTSMGQFATGLGGSAFALRIRQNGEVLVGNGVNILRLNAAGAIIQTYDVAGENAWFALNLDPDGMSFWSADFSTANVYRIDIATGNVITTFNTGTGGNTVFGLTVNGEITAATVLNIEVAPTNSTKYINNQHCVTATVTDQNAVPQENVNVVFVVGGVNAPQNFAGNTNALGQIEFCYMGTNIGRDTIFATIGTSGRSDTAYVLWEDPLPVELSSFTSSVSSNDVKLNWSTSEEINNSGFDIERSSNGTWTKIGNVNGNGSTNEIKNYSYTDKNVSSGTYNYRLKQIDYNGSFEYYNLSNEVIVGVPDKFSISQNYPNPFNPSTKIDFQLPTDGNVKLSVFDNSGKQVEVLSDGFKSAGYYSINFNATNLSSGIYFYKIEFNGISKVMKMSLLK